MYKDFMDSIKFLYMWVEISHIEEIERYGTINDLIGYDKSLELSRFSVLRGLSWS